ncbi:hypothetical protein EIZ47_03235 [Chryseobacterium lacus]|uniref:DUF4843 domain-containing protein n=1 Tax=Chryseobacterium lacus TaxID=2058346 RepID=A0A368N1K4_9FLAO|nr:hypothetical protein [Chryseobacterium lacus]RCU44050.1 hypothetical protein DQ356_03275 [Chryseobacterium lacus]RST28979.1 hypothetical protein EIZ47_03235 [Chryseobacterium lacus]
MKSIKYLLAIFSLLFLVTACREDHTEPGYTGSPYLHFNFGIATNEVVTIGSASKDIQVKYGVIQPVTGSHQVKLVVDPSSTAVEGVDFVILNPTDELANGETGGAFSIRLLEPASPSDLKKAVFKLESSTIANAVFDNEFILNWKLQCLVSDFLSGGTSAPFTYAGTWNGTGVYTIEEVPGSTNTLRILDYPEPGTNFIFRYNDEGVVTYEPQKSGYVYQSAPYAGLEAIVTPIPGKASSIDMCSKKLVIQANFMLEGTNAGFLNQVENFTGF